MNKADLIASMAKNNGLSVKANSDALDSLMTVVVRTVAKGEAVSLVNFMNIEPVRRAERKGRNPRTKEEIMIPETYAPRARFGKMFKEKVATAVGAKEAKKAEQKAARAAAAAAKNSTPAAAPTAAPAAKPGAPKRPQAAAAK